jgi:hypothetical protein
MRRTRNPVTGPKISKIRRLARITRIPIHKGNIQLLATPFSERLFTAGPGFAKSGRNAQLH